MQGMQVSVCVWGEASDLLWMVRQNEEYIMKHGKCKAFHMGSNSPC